MAGVAEIACGVAQPQADSETPDSSESRTRPRDAAVGQSAALGITFVAPWTAPLLVRRVSVVESPRLRPPVAVDFDVDGAESWVAVVVPERPKRAVGALDERGWRPPHLSPS